MEGETTGRGGQLHNFYLHPTGLNLITQECPIAKEAKDTVIL